METRVADCEIKKNGEVIITTSSQAPYTVKELISNIFGIDKGKVIVNVPLVGGGFGGKAPVFLEILAYIASQAVSGKLVRLSCSREEDFITAPRKTWFRI